jgi:hypothetical protein
MAHRRRAYWRLPDFNERTAATLFEDLNQQQYHVAKSSSKAKLVKASENNACSLLSYGRCELDDLRLFARRRCLIPWDGKGPSRTTLIRLLTEADDSPRFEQFNDLPAELRVRIYEYYIDSFRTQPTTLSSPPLAQTSKLLRQEVLPVFHSRCVFQLEFIPYLGSIDPVNKRQYLLSDPTELFQHHLCQGTASQLRKIHIQLDRFHRQ